jgi:RNA polymerase sigma-70 factor (ECF subfamily)
MNESRISVNDLAKACAYSANAAEWEEFLRRTTPLVSLVVLRVARLWMIGSPPAIVDDIVQEVFVKVCERERRILREFKPRGEDSFLGLLRIVSVSVANDYLRSINSAKRGGNVVTTHIAGEADPGVADGGRDAKEVQRTVLLLQLDRKLRSATGVIGARDRDMFWLYFLQGFTAEEIAGIPAMGLTAKGVESALRRVAAWLRVELQRSG